ncbi:MAG: hypothetical protein F6K19_47135, partial [Cyanothece sp. SIO1E1]|nr:hypothetical protein [Cyanothece sp. SIO1E1]
AGNLSSFEVAFTLDRSPFAPPLTLSGGDGDDSLLGGDGNDTLSGGQGNDTLQGGFGADVIDGGEGLDTAVFSDIPFALNADLNTGEAIYTNDAGIAIVDQLTDVENLVGNDLENQLVGDAGANVLSGAGGADTLAGGLGDDEIFGGDGADILRGDLNEGTSGGTTGGNDTIFGGTGDDVIGGEAGNDSLSGDLGDDSLLGEDGNDSLLGGNGNDTLEGDAGDDILFGGEGSDQLTGGTGSDRFVIADGILPNQHSIVTDFQPGVDVLEIRELSGISQFTNLSLQASGSDTIIRALGQDLAIIQNVLPTDLGPADFNIISTAVTPPVVAAALSDDTGISNTDGITANPIVSGTITTTGQVVEFKAGFNDTPTENFVDVLASLQPDGSFLLALAQLEAIYGSTLPDGVYTLHLQAGDAAGNRSSWEVAFTLDQTAPVLSLEAPFAEGDHSNTARLIGAAADAGAGLATAESVVDEQPSTTLTINAQGEFDQTLQSEPLAAGAHQLTVNAVDLAGNTSQTTVDFQVADDFVVSSAPDLGWGIKTADSIFLAEQDSFLTQTTFAVDLGQPEGSRTLRFDLNAQFDLTDTTTVLEDQLLISLVDPANPSQTLLPGYEPGSALFSLSGDTAEFTPGLVRYDGSAVEIDLTSLADATSGLLLFQLLNNDGDSGSVVQVENLTNVVDEAGVASPVFPMDMNLATAGPALDLAGLNTTTDLAVTFSNVRLEAATGQYVANLQVQNLGAAVDRQVAVVFADLPTGVELLNASGVDANGAAYINLRHAIRPGGLESGDSSDPVEVILANPALVRLNLSPQVLVGGANQAPVFEAIEPLTVMPGGKLSLPLVATDPNGDAITFSLQSNGALPTGRLAADGTLEFTPKPDQLGAYEFTVIATDGVLETSQTLTLNVVADTVSLVIALQYYPHR